MIVIMKFMNFITHTIIIIYILISIYYISQFFAFIFFLNKNDKISIFIHYKILSLNNVKYIFKKIR